MGLKARSLVGDAWPATSIWISSVGLVGSVLSPLSAAFSAGLSPIVEGFEVLVDLAFSTVGAVEHDQRLTQIG